MLSLSSLDRVDQASWASRSGEMLVRLEGWAYHTPLAGRLEPPPPPPPTTDRKASISSYCHEIFVAVVSNFNTGFHIFLDKKYSQQSRNSLAFLYICIFRHLLGCVKQLFLPSEDYMGGVLHIPSDRDDLWKLKSTPKRTNILNTKINSQLKKVCPKKSQNGKFQTKKKDIHRLSWWLGKTCQSTTPSPIQGQNGKFPHIPDWQSW